MKAMLYTEVDSTTAYRLMAQRDYVVEQKFDGARLLTRLDQETEKVLFLQRSGAPMKFAAAALHLPQLESALGSILRSSPTGTVLDGELIVGTGIYHVFDLVNPSLGMTYQNRRVMLDSTLEGWGFENVVTVRQATEYEDKVRLTHAVQVAGGEGVMVKHLHEPYLPGARSRTTVKYKFVKTADVVVLDWTRGRNAAGREIGSISFGAVQDGELVPLGNCSIIGKPAVAKGDVIEVAYLYRQDGGALVQPRMMRVREDKAPEDCTMAQFPVYSRKPVEF